MSRILLTGKNGQVGWELQRALLTVGEVVAFDRQGMDLANPDAIRTVIREVKPKLIVNAAAYTDVDQAEKEPQAAMAINGTAPGILAEEAKRLGAAIVHYSTDYVFDGTKAAPYTEEDAPNPINVYGKSKLAGEQAIQAVGVPHLIFRTSWVYGARGKNFLLTVRRLAKEREELRIVADQTGAPTWSRTIAEATGQILASCLSPGQGGFRHLEEHSGTYHLSSAGETTWYGFAVAIVDRIGSNGPRHRVVPINSSEYPKPARRPANSRLSSEVVAGKFGLALPDWALSLALCADDLLQVHN
jgi:dTDP-4-dehydrorhamnose reductase